MQDGKGAVWSIGVMGPAIAMVVLLLNHFVFKGEVVTTEDSTNLVDAVSAIVGLVTGIIGRIRATKAITKVI
jgi:hypothetical protein